MQQPINRIAITILAIVSIAFDQFTKVWARNSLQGAGRDSYLGDTFRLEYTENTGAFLSLGSGLDGWGRILLLQGLPLIMILALAVYVMVDKQLLPGQRYGFAMIVGGGISNLFDRIMYGGVVDFMNMGVGDLRTGIFNFADVFIMVGMGLILWTQFRAGNKEQAAVTSAGATELKAIDKDVEDGKAEEE